MTIEATCRRALSGGLAAEAIGLAAPALVRAAQAQAQAAEVDIWSRTGFVTDAFVQEFTGETGIKVNIRLVSDRGEQFNLMAVEQGQHAAGIVCVAGHRFHQSVDAGLLSPVDLTRPTGRAQIETEIVNAERVRRRGEIRGVPLAVVSSGLTHNGDEMEPPDSPAVMSDPARVAAPRARGGGQQHARAARAHR